MTTAKKCLYALSVAAIVNIKNLALKLNELTRHTMSMDKCWEASAVAHEAELSNEELTFLAFLPPDAWVAFGEYVEARKEPEKIDMWECASGPEEGVPFVATLTVTGFGTADALVVRRCIRTCSLIPKWQRKTGLRGELPYQFAVNNDSRGINQLYSELLDIGADCHVTITLTEKPKVDRPVPVVEQDTEKE